MMRFSFLLLLLIPVLVCPGCGMPPGGNGDYGDMTGRWQITDVESLTVPGPNSSQSQYDQIYAMVAGSVMDDNVLYGRMMYQGSVFDFYPDYTFRSQGRSITAGEEGYTAQDYGNVTTLQHFETPASTGAFNTFGVWMPDKGKPGSYCGIMSQGMHMSVGWAGGAQANVQGGVSPVAWVLLEDQGDTKIFKFAGMKATFKRIGPPEGDSFGNEGVDDNGRVVDMRQEWSRDGNPQALQRFKAAAGHIMHVQLGDLPGETPAAAAPQPASAPAPAAAPVTATASPTSPNPYVAPPSAAVVPAPAPAAPPRLGGYLGISMADGPQGPFVTAVFAGTPAVTRLLPADTIVMCDRTPVRNVAQLSGYLFTCHPGQSVQFTIRRNGQLMAGPIVLAARPAPTP